MLGAHFCVFACARARKVFYIHVSNFVYPYVTGGWHQTNELFLSDTVRRLSLLLRELRAEKYND